MIIVGIDVASQKHDYFMVRPCLVKFYILQYKNLIYQKIHSLPHHILRDKRADGVPELCRFRWQVP